MPAGALLRLGWALLFLLMPVVVAHATGPRRVLIIHSFGREFAPFDAMSSAFRTELAQRSPEPVEFHEATLLMMRFAGADNDGPLVKYLQTVFGEQRLDLIVAVAEPAVDFCIRQRAELFPDTPLLAHVDQRREPAVLATTQATLVPVRVEIPTLVENILQVLPDTTHVALVLGASPFERRWAELCREGFAGFTNRIRFTYLNDLPMDRVRELASQLPPHSAILYGMLAVDAAGVPYEQERALSIIRAVANAPIFGPFQSQLGKGIVGGRLISLEDSGRQAARVALRLLRGEMADAVAMAPTQSARPVYDWTELRRWNISPSRLLPGAEVRFRVPTFWEQYKWRLIGIHALCLLEGVLIFALLRNRRRLRRTESELRQSEERLSLATHSAKVGVWSWDIRDGRIEATPECKQMFGFAGGEPVTFGRFLERVHPDDRGLVEGAVGEAIRSGSVYDTQYRVTLPEGRIRWIAARGRLKAASNDMLGVVLDVTERKEAEAQVQRHRHELAHVSRLSILGELSASMAHELNQPLTAILANAQAARRFMASGTLETDELKAILSDIARDTTRARDVIRHLRALVKKSEPSFTRVDLADAIREAAGFLQGDMAARNVRVVLDLAPDLPAVSGDRTQIQQVVINLLLNAFDAVIAVPVPDRLVNVGVTVESPTTLRVTVRDNGTGIPPDRLDAVFDPFVTTKPDGMGMGLSVTRSIVESHHGRIWAQNNPEGGVSFHLTLPTAEIPTRHE